MRVFTLVGSLRSTSSTVALARALGRVAPDGVEVDVYDGLAALPPFSPDLDDRPPGAVVELRAAVGRAQALAVVSPEYAHGMPGALKNALDWLVSAVEPLGKPVLLVCASPAGAVHAHAQFTEVLRTMSLPLVDGGAHVFSRARIDDDGEVTDPPMLAGLRASMIALTEAAVRPDDA